MAETSHIPSISGILLFLGADSRFRGGTKTKGKRSRDRSVDDNYTIERGLAARELDELTSKASPKITPRRNHAAAETFFAEIGPLAFRNCAPLQN